MFSGGREEEGTDGLILGTANVVGLLLHWLECSQKKTGEGGGPAADFRCKTPSYRYRCSVTNTRREFASSPLLGRKKMVTHRRMKERGDDHASRRRLSSPLRRRLSRPSPGETCNPRGGLYSTMANRHAVKLEIHLEV